MCDIYVACLSSTIPLAIACGKPVINYDVYRLSNSHPSYAYADSPGVITVTNHNDYVQVVKQMTSDHVFLSDIGKQSSADSNRWGQL